MAEHDELCFGCGQANLLGLQLDWERVEGGVSGRFLVKQDHQGPGGVAHPSVLTAALEEAMTLAAGSRPRRAEVSIGSPAQVGSAVAVVASGERGEMLAEACEVPGAETGLKPGLTTDRSINKMPGHGK